MKLVNGIAILLAGHCPMLVGCGSSSSESNLAGYSFNSPDGPTQNLIGGRVELGAPVGNLPIALEFGGAAIGGLTSGRSGAFQAIAPSTNGQSASFRVTAQLPDGTVLAQDVENYSGGSLFLQLNVPTTLVSRYRRAHPGVDLASAEAKVRTFLQIPAGRNLSYGINETPSERFSHLAFLLRASQNGGLSNFLDQVVAQLDTPQNRGQVGAPYLLREASFQASLTGLHPSLATIAQEIRQEPGKRARARLAALPPQMDQLDLILGGAAPTGGAPANVSPRLVDTLLTGLETNLISVWWTHMADSMNLNYGTTVMLGNIQDQLNVIQAGVDALLADFSTAAFTNSAQHAQVAIDNLTTNFSLMNVIDMSSAVTTNEQPRDIPSDIGSYLSQITTYFSQNDLQLFYDVLLPGSSYENIVTTYRDHTYKGYGVNTSSSNGFGNVRSNVVLGGIATPLNYYGGYQQLACNFLSEGAHTALTDPGNGAPKYLNPTVPINSTANLLVQAVANFKHEFSQLPILLPDDNVIVDLDNGLMWYAYVQSEESLSGAHSYAQGTFTHQVGDITYSDWHLPTQQELDGLHERGKAAGGGSNGSTVQGLINLGFKQTSYLSSQGSVLYSDYYYDTHDKKWERNLDNALAPNDKYDLNGTPGSNLYSDNGKVPYFIVRSIGEPVQTKIGPTTITSSTGYPFDWNNPGSLDYQYFGTVSGISGLTNLANTAVATLNYKIETGTPYTTSKTSDGTTLYTSDSTIIHRIHNGNVNTYSGSTVNDLNNLVAVLPDTSSQSKVLVGALNQLFWHSSDPVTVNLTGSVLSSNGTTYSTSLSNYTYDPPARVLNKVQIFPRNQIYRETTVGGSAYIYSAVGFYADRQTVDFSQQVTWKVEDAANPGVPPAGTSFNSNTLFVSRTSPPLLNVTCSIDGVVQDTVQVSVLAQNNPELAARGKEPGGTTTVPPGIPKLRPRFAKPVAAIPRPEPRRWRRHAQG